MLYYLFRYLSQYGIPGSHMWSYISFRAILTLVLSLIISAWFGEWFIKWMKARKLSEEQRDPSIDPYGVNKIGVPTMGGIIIIIATVIPALLFGRLRNIYMLIMLGTTLWLGLLGFIDDYTKMKKGKDGIRFLRKIVPGGTDDSYGIDVAKLAGLPPRVTNRAKALLAEMEAQAAAQKSAPVQEEAQFSFDAARESEIPNKLRQMNIAELSDAECREFLEELYSMLA